MCWSPLGERHYSQASFAYTPANGFAHPTFGSKLAAVTKPDVRALPRYGSVHSCAARSRQLCCVCWGPRFPSPLHLPRSPPKCFRQEGKRKSCEDRR